MCFFSIFHKFPFKQMPSFHQQHHFVPAVEVKTQTKCHISRPNYCCWLIICSHSSLDSSTGGNNAGIVFLFFVFFCGHFLVTFRTEKVSVFLCVCVCATPAPLSFHNMPDCCLATLYYKAASCPRTWHYVPSHSSQVTKGTCSTKETW